MAATTYHDIYTDWDGDDRAALTTKYINMRFPKYHNKYNTEPYTPVYKIMKEFYDEEKEYLYCTPHHASVNDSQMQFWDIFYNGIERLTQHREQNVIGQLLNHHTLQSTKYMAKWIEAKNGK